jgi:hypothetical protein
LGEIKNVINLCSVVLGVSLRTKRLLDFSRL